MKFKSIAAIITLLFITGCTTYTQTHVEGSEKKGKTTLASSKDQPQKPDGAASIKAIQPKSIFDSISNNALKTLIESIKDSSGQKVAGSNFFSWKGYPDLVHLKPDTYEITIKCSNGHFYNFHKFKVTLGSNEDLVAFCLPEISGIMIEAMHAFIVPKQNYEEIREKFNNELNPPKKTAKNANQSIQIESGKKIFAEIIIENDQITHLISVIEIKNPEITVTFNFTKLNDGMMLSVNNPFSNALKYNIDMIDMKGKKHQTSSCPVMAGGSVFESWPHPIPKLEIKNFRLLDEKEKIGCIY